MPFPHNGASNYEGRLRNFALHQCRAYKLLGLENVVQYVYVLMIQSKEYVGNMAHIRNMIHITLSGKREVVPLRPASRQCSQQSNSQASFDTHIATCKVASSGFKVTREAAEGMKKSCTCF
jgi:hypothetical protein